MAKILLLSVDRAFAARIADLAGAGASVDLVQSITPDLLDGPTLILLDQAALPADRSLGPAIRAVAESAPGRPILLATDDRDADQVLHAVRAGAHDIIPRDGEGEEAAAILTRLLNGARAEQAEGGRLTLVLGADPEAAALVATDMALTRAGASPSTLLIDCTLPTSAAQAYLDLPVSYGLASAIADMERLDASLLSSALARHQPSSLMLMTFDGGTGSEPAGIAPGDIAALVRLLRGCAGEIILCAGSLRHGGLLRDLAAMADRIDLVCAQSIRQLESARRQLERIGPDSAALARTRLLVWDHQPGVMLDGRRMADLLGLAAHLPLPVDHARLLNALNAGRPLALEGDGGPYLQAIRRAAGAPLTPARNPLATIRRALQRRLERAA